MCNTEFKMRFYPQIIVWTYILLPAISLLLLPRLVFSIARAQQQRAKLMANALTARGRAAAALARNHQRRYIPNYRYTNNFGQNRPFKLRAKREVDNPRGISKLIPPYEENHKDMDFVLKKAHWDQQEEALGQLQNMWNMNNFGATQNPAMVRSTNLNTESPKSMDESVGNPYIRGKGYDNGNPDHYSDAFSERNVYDQVLEQNNPMINMKNEGGYFSPNMEQKSADPKPTLHLILDLLNKKKQSIAGKPQNYYSSESYPYYPYDRESQTMEMSPNIQDEPINTQILGENFSQDLEQRTADPEPTFHLIKALLDKKKQLIAGPPQSYYSSNSYPYYPYARESETMRIGPNIKDEGMNTEMLGENYSQDMEQRSADPEPTFHLIKALLNKKKQLIAGPPQNYYSSNSYAYSPYDREAETMRMGPTIQDETINTELLGENYSQDMEQRSADPEPTFHLIKALLNKKKQLIAGPPQNYYTSNSYAYSPYDREAEPMRMGPNIQDETINTEILGENLFQDTEPKSADPEPTFFLIHQLLNKKKELIAGPPKNYYSSNSYYPYGRESETTDICPNIQEEPINHQMLEDNFSENTKQKSAHPEPTFQVIKRKVAQKKQMKPRYSAPQDYYSRESETTGMFPDIQNGPIETQMLGADMLSEIQQRSAIPESYPQQSHAAGQDLPYSSNFQERNNEDVAMEKDSEQRDIIKKEPTNQHQLRENPQLEVRSSMNLADDHAHSEDVGCELDDKLFDIKSKLLDLKTDDGSMDPFAYYQRAVESISEERKKIAETTKQLLDPIEKVHPEHIPLTPPSEKPQDVAVDYVNSGEIPYNTYNNVPSQQQNRIDPTNPLEEKSADPNADPHSHTHGFSHTHTHFHSHTHNNAHVKNLGKYHGHQTVLPVAPQHYIPPTSSGIQQLPVYPAQQDLSNGGFSQAHAKAQVIHHEGIQHSYAQAESNSLSNGFGPNTAIAQAGAQAVNTGGFGQSASQAVAQAGLVGQNAVQNFGNNFPVTTNIDFGNNQGQFAMNHATSEVVGQQHVGESFFMPQMDEIPVRDLLHEIEFDTHRFSRSSDDLHNSFKGLELASNIVDASLDGKKLLDANTGETINSEPEDVQNTMSFVTNIVDSSLNAGGSNNQNSDTAESARIFQKPESIKSTKDVVFKGISSITDLVNKSIRSKRQNIEESNEATLEKEFSLKQDSLNNNGDDVITKSELDVNDDNNVNLQKNWGEVNISKQDKILQTESSDDMLQTNGESGEKNGIRDSNNNRDNAKNKAKTHNSNSDEPFKTMELGRTENILNDNKDANEKNGQGENEENKTESDILRDPTVISSKAENMEHSILEGTERREISDTETIAANSPTEEFKNNLKLSPMDQKEESLNLADADTMPVLYKESLKTTDFKNFETKKQISSKAEKSTIEDSTQDTIMNHTLGMTENINSPSKNIFEAHDAVTINNASPNKLDNHVESGSKINSTESKKTNDKDIAEKDYSLGVKHLEDSKKIPLKTMQHSSSIIKDKDAEFKEVTDTGTPDQHLPSLSSAVDTKYNIPALTSDEIEELQFDIIPKIPDDKNNTLYSESKSNTTKETLLGAFLPDNKNLKVKEEDITEQLENGDDNILGMPINTNDKGDDPLLNDTLKDDNVNISKIFSPPIINVSRDNSTQKIIFNISGGPFDSIESEMNTLTDEEKDAFIKQEMDLILEVIEETFKNKNEETKNKTVDATADNKKGLVVSTPNIFQVFDRDSTREEYSRQAGEKTPNKNDLDAILGEHRQKIEDIKKDATNGDMLMISSIAASVLKDLESRRNESSFNHVDETIDINNSNQTNHPKENNQTNYNFQTDIENQKIETAMGETITHDNQNESTITNKIIINQNNLAHKPNQSHDGGFNRSKREIDSLRISRAPLTQLITDPATKLDVEKTLANLGSIARHTFENPRAPIYHVRNMLGNAKNSIMSAAKVPPNNFLIPSKYEIAKISENNQNNARLGAINQKMVLSRSGFGNNGIIKQPERAFKEDNFELEDTVQKIGGLVRESVNSGRDLVAHANDAAIDAKKLLYTTRNAVPRLIVPRRPILTSRASYADPSSLSLLSQSGIGSKPMLITPKIFDMQQNTLESTEAVQPESFVGMGNVLDAAGISQPNQNEVEWQKIVFEPLVGKNRASNLHKEFDPSKTLKNWMADGLKKKTYEPNAILEAQKMNSIEVPDSLHEAEKAVGAENLTDFLLRMHNEMKEIVKSQYEERKRKRKQKTKKPKTKPPQKNKKENKQFKRPAKQILTPAEDSRQKSDLGTLGDGITYFNEKNYNENEAVPLPSQLLSYFHNIPQTSLNQNTNSEHKDEAIVSNIPPIFSRIQEKSINNYYPEVSKSDISISKVVKKPVPNIMKSSVRRGENSDNIDEEEKVELFLPPNLMKPFMGQPSEALLDDYMRINGDEVFEQDPSGDSKQISEMSGTPPALDLNIAKGEPLSPFNPNSVFSEPLTVSQAPSKYIIDGKPTEKNDEEMFVKQLSTPEIDEFEILRQNQKNGNNSVKDDADVAKTPILAKIIPPLQNSIIGNLKEGSTENSAPPTENKNDEKLKHDSILKADKMGEPGDAISSDNLTEKHYSLTVNNNLRRGHRMPDENDLGYVLGAINPIMFERYFNERLNISDTGSKDAHQFLQHRTRKDNSNNNGEHNKVKENTGDSSDRKFTATNPLNKEQKNNQLPEKIINEPEHPSKTRVQQINPNINPNETIFQSEKNTLSQNVSQIVKTRNEEDINKTNSTSRTSMKILDTYKKPFLGYLSKDKVTKFLHQYNNLSKEDIKEQRPENNYYWKDVPVKNVVFSSLESNEDYNTVS